MGKYLKYWKYIGVGILVVIAVVWGLSSHATLVRLEAENAALTKANDGLKKDMLEQRARWEERFYALEAKSKKLEETVAKINSEYATLLKKHQALEKELASVTIPIANADKVAKFKEMEYTVTEVAKGTPSPHDGIIADWNNADKMLQDLMTIEVIERLNIVLKEEVLLLESKVKAQEEIIENTQREVRLALDRAEFAEGQIEMKDRIIEDQTKVVEDSLKAAKRAKYLWGGIGAGLGILFMVGLGMLGL